MKRLNKILFFRFAFIGAALLLVAAFWYVLNWETRPIFIQREMATFKKNFDGTGLGFTFGQGSMKGRDYARILGWGVGWGPDKVYRRVQFLWFSWTSPAGQIFFDFSSDIRLTGQDISTLVRGEMVHSVGQEYVPFHGTRINTIMTWRDYCAEEIEPDGVTVRLVCDEKGILNEPLARLKEQIPSISKMEVVEYLFSQ